MKRLAIFAGYDKDNIIDDYVVYYIKELKKVADIVYVCNCNMLESELDKISNYCIHIINGEHGEFDFGSYKRGFIYVRNNKIIFDYDYLMLINDSVFGPFFDLKTIVENMEKKDLDAWAMFHCLFDHINIEHLQSYFISIKKKIFITQNFVYFMQSITKLDSKYDMIIHHEFGLTKFFLDNNYKIGGYFDSSNIKTENDNNLPFHKSEELIRNGFPFFKRSILEPSLRLQTYNFTVDNWNNILNTIENNYDINLIKNNIERVLNIDSNTLLPKIEQTTEDNISKKDKCFKLFGLESNDKYQTLYIFGIKITIKR
ncbi:hypothetical protein BRSU_2795 [Brachyspira suanatina]|uniref:Uncharacterized protein n=1 Tax=Brachyspira suanatina TaxID=381802 RepID=A0A0G4KB50_9SPIR|nr:rhamnan synthesis F family protein [Brachyspira suanatina]CRF35671.1 hypothetical protein BRSU_2795 [Brachyspira suanatina]